MSKFAALALTHAVRQAGWDTVIRATAVCPGFVATETTKWLTDRRPDHLSQPDNIARIVALLLDLPGSVSVAEIDRSTLENIA
jgi:NADP-dependent 3-hydroxy acid dehydrogenase YdfG